MILSLIFGLLIGAVSVVFALQNIFPVTVTFIVWEVTTSLALIIVLAVLIGLMIGVILSIPETIRSMFAISNLKKENQKLSTEIESINETTRQALEIKSNDQSVS